MLVLILFAFKGTCFFGSSDNLHRSAIAKNGIVIASVNCSK